MADLLIVEDEREFREAVATYFRLMYGWTVHEAADPDEAIRLIPGLKLDAILVDKRMPFRGQLDNSAGDYVMRWLYDRNQLADLCAVMLTGYGELDSASLALAMGAWQYLQKPMEPSEIYRLVAPGIALKRCHRLRRQVVNQEIDDSIRIKIGEILKETLAPDIFRVILERGGNCEDLMTGEKIDPVPRLVREIREGKPFIYAATRAEVREYEPVLKDAGKLMAVPVVINHDDPHGVVWMESQQEGAFDPRWQEVLSYLADLVGLSETIRRSREREQANLRLFNYELRHRINNSLSTMYWQADGLLRELGPQERDARAERAVEKVKVIQRHVQIVSDVLKELTEATKELAFRRDPCATDQMAIAALDEKRGEFQDAGVNPGLGPMEAAATVIADREKVDYCLECLLQNAIEAVVQARPWKSAGDEPPIGQDPLAAPPAERVPDVTISIGKTEKWGEIRVRDRGIGFDEDIEPRLFAPLFSTKKVRTPDAKNMGMGLYTVKRYVEAMGGQVLASSPGARQGAEFTIRLPLLPEG